MKVFELARAYDATVADVRLEGRLIGLKDLRPNSDLAKYQADEIAKRLIQRAQARRPSLERVTEPQRVAADFRGLPPLEREIMALLERPNNNAVNADVSRVNLGLLREGLGLSIELGAAITGVHAADLERWEADSATPSWRVVDLLSAYAVHMAAMWGFSQLRLDARNFEDIERVPAESRTPEPRRYRAAQTSRL